MKKSKPLTQVKVSYYYRFSDFEKISKYNDELNDLIQRKKPIPYRFYVRMFALFQDKLDSDFNYDFIEKKEADIFLTEIVSHFSKARKSMERIKFDRILGSEFQKYHPFDTGRMEDYSLLDVVKKMYSIAVFNKNKGLKKRAFLIKLKPEWKKMLVENTLSKRYKSLIGFFVEHFGYAEDSKNDKKTYRINEYYVQLVDYHLSNLLPKKK